MVTKTKRTDAKPLAKDGQLSKEGAGTFGPSAFLNQVFTKVKPKRFDVTNPMESTPEPEKKQVEEKPKVNIDDLVNELLTKNPTMSSSTFLNLLKSQGITFVKEADMASSMPQLARGKESAISFRTMKFKEKTNQTTDIGINKPKQPNLGFTKFRSVMLQEGLGNFADAYFYTKEALQTAAPIFEGKKIFADHPSSLDEQIRPERSVRDVLGHFENVHVEETDDGRSQLVGDVVILPDESFKWARSLMSHAVEFHTKFPDKEFIGLSINASGDASPVSLTEFMKTDLPESVMLKLKEAQEQSIETIKVVSSIKSAISCDLVTEAGAGGSLTKYLENNKQNLNKEGFNMAKQADDKKIENEEMKQADGEQPQGDHADAAQDVQLIKDMLKKAFGGDEEPTEEECNVAKQAMESYAEMGHPKEKCDELAMEFMKASKHMAAKQAKKEADAKPVDEEKEEKPVEESDEVPEKKDEVKESNKLKEELLKLRGELTRYKESDKKREIELHIDKLCKESKKSNFVTKEFKPLVKDAKSVDEVNKAWKLFEAGLKQNETNVDFNGITFATEKLNSVADGEHTGLDFSDCKVF